MGREIALDTPSGRICAWRADPMAQPVGGLVVIQEIFGVNEHVRSVVERYCAEGWVALAPELFDPIERGVELAYDDAGVSKGRALAAELGFDDELYFSRLFKKATGVSPVHFREFETAIRGGLARARGPSGGQP